MALIDRLLRGDDRDPDDVRMTLGEHLEELRSRVLRSVVALVLGAVVCYCFADRIEGVMTTALFDVLKKHDFPPNMMYTGIAETFIADFQIALILGFILTAPYIIWQMWGFVAAGLYRHERKWVRRFVPVSIALFYVGAIFFLVVVVPLFLDFFIGYKKELPRYPSYINLFSHPHAASTQPSNILPNAVRFPVLSGDPINPPEGSVWMNQEAHELRMQMGGKPYTLVVPKEANVNHITPMITIQDYLIFILQMAAAFGGGFQVPVVTALLATIGIASSSQMAKARKYIWFGIAVAAAVITPSPDVSSMLLLFVPMTFLFEAGLIASRLIEKERAKAQAAG